VAEPGSFERRAFAALALAAGAGLVAAFVAAAAVDREPYDDGIELFLPTTAAAAGTGVAVLLGFAALEWRRGNRGRLAAAARGMAGLCLVVGTLGMAAFGAPLWIALPYAAVAAGLCLAVASLLRRPRRHRNPTSHMSHSGVQSPPGGEG
jgi:peptidoglycan/LPS O-acetylase OafA/YrhL